MNQENQKTTLAARRKTRDKIQRRRKTLQKTQYKEWTNRQLSDRFIIEHSIESINDKTLKDIQKIRIHYQKNTNRPIGKTENQDIIEHAINQIIKKI